jgi:hypothetical protein
MSVWCSGRGGFARGRGHGFEPRQPRSVATLREKMRDLRRRRVGGWRTTASTETICAGTRSLADAPPASKDPFYPPAQIVCGLVSVLQIVGRLIIIFFAGV